MFDTAMRMSMLVSRIELSFPGKKKSNLTVIIGVWLCDSVRPDVIPVLNVILVSTPYQ
jgi:hypothetical protein